MPLLPVGCSFRRLRRGLGNLSTRSLLRWPLWPLRPLTSLPSLNPGDARQVSKRGHGPGLCCAHPHRSGEPRANGPLARTHPRETPAQRPFPIRWTRGRPPVAGWGHVWVGTSSVRSGRLSRWWLKRPRRTSRPPRMRGCSPAQGLSCAQAKNEKRVSATHFGSRVPPLGGLPRGERIEAPED